MQVSIISCCHNTGQNEVQVVWICTSCSNSKRSILLLLSRVNQFSSKICSRGPSLGKWRSIEESELNLNLNHCEMSKFMLTCFLLVYPGEKSSPSFFPMPTPISYTNKHARTNTYTPETRTPSGCDGWLQHSGCFYITGSDRGSFNESFVCVSSQAFQAANE